MSAVDESNSTEISAELLARARRVGVTVVVLALIVGSGWLGIVLAPYLSKILMIAAAAVLIGALVVCVIDFFRDS